MKIKTYDFTNLGGRTTDGRSKTHWPDQLTLVFTTPREALELARELLHKHISHEEGQDLFVTFCGKHEETHDG